MKLTLTLVIISVLTVTAYGQSSTDRYAAPRGLNSGTLLRIEADSLGPVCGRLESVSTSHDTIHLGPWPDHPNLKSERELNYKPVNKFGKYRPLSEPTDIRTDAISRIYKKGNKAGNGALIGGIAGAASFVGLAVAWDEAWPGETASSDKFRAGLIGGAIGAGIGALIGSIFPSWKEVYAR